MAFREFKPDEWAEEISSGLDFRRKFGVETAWGALEAMYYNVHASMANDGPNVIMSTGDALLSSLSVPTPAIIVKPERPEAVSRAPYVEALDNVFLRELVIADEVDTAELNAYLFGVGVLKVGYDSEFGFNPNLDVGGALRLGFTLTQLDDKGKRRIEHDSTVSPGMPWVSSVDPRDIVVPWGTHRLTKTPWIAHRFIRQIDDLKNDPKYSNVSRLSPTLSMEDFVGSYKATVRMWRPSSGTSDRSLTRRQRPRFTSRGSRTVEFVELYEIHDRRTGKILVISPDHPSFLRNDINALQIDNVLPFASISFTPKSRAFWTTSDAYYLQAMQMEISDLAVQRTKIRRLAVLKFLYDEDVIDEEEIQKLVSPEVGAAAKIKQGMTGRLNEAVMEIRTTVDQTLILEEEHLRRNVREQIGFSRNQLGEFAGGRRTATEAKIVDVSSTRRLSRRGKAVQRLYQDTISIINAIIFQHWTLPRHVEVMGETQANEWVEITGPELKSRYSYDVIFTDDAELRQRRREALQEYMILSQDPSIDPIALRQYISDQYNDPAFSRLFNADIQNAMRAMRLAGGLVQPETLNQGGGGQANRGGAGGAGGSQLPGLGQLLLQGGNGQGGGAGGGRTSVA